MEGQYLIPANSKKSMLIFGLFNPFDLVIFMIGLGVTLLLMMILDVSNIVNVIIVITPLLVSAFLVMPVPNYHNIMTILKSMFEFYTNRQTFIWKGWCFTDGEHKK